MDLGDKTKVREREWKDCYVRSKWGRKRLELAKEKEKMRNKPKKERNEPATLLADFEMKWKWRRLIK